MTTWKIPAGLVLLLSLLVVVPPAGLADDTELFTTSANPNVLLMLDVSASMNTGTGDTTINDLDGNGNSNTRIDALWKVVYTLLNADLSVPSHIPTTTITCTTVRARRWNSTTIDTDISSSRQYQYVEVNSNATTWALFPGSTTTGGTVIIGSGGQSENMTYTSRSSGSPYRFYFSSAKTFGRRFNQGTTISYTYTASGPPVDYSQNYPTSHAEATSDDFLNNLTTADESILKARIGMMTFSGSLGFLSASTFRINTWNTIASTAPNAPPFSPSYAAIWDNVTHHANLDLYTPTAKSLDASHSFFNTAYNPGQICRPNFAVLITDGEDTMGGIDGATGGTADYYNSSVFCADGWNGSTCPGGTGQGQVPRHNAVIQEAYNLKTFSPTVKLFTVGVGLSGEDPDIRVQREVLRRAAEQQNATGTVAQFNAIGASGDNTSRGRGEDGNMRAFFASNAEDLSIALRNVFHQINLGMYSFTAPTVASVRMTDRNYVYKASFAPSTPPSTFWKGSLQAGTINDNGSITWLWDADTLLKRDPSYRRVYTADNTTRARIDFTSVTPGMLAVPDSGTRDNVVNYVLGYGHDNNAKLGDIFHSKPVVVGPPSQFYFDEGYSTAIGGDNAFVSLKSQRKRVVYVGTNDGMLHAFLSGVYDNGTYTSGTGEEFFGYVPYNLLRNLEDFVPADLSTHGYYVDSSPRVADVWVDSNSDGVKQSSEWRTVLVSGMRKGGNGYFALDVTDPPGGTGIGTASSTYPQVLWEYTDSAHLGESWSEPFIGKVKVTTGSTVRDRWVAIFGGGVGSLGVGASVVVLDIATGHALKTFTTADGLDNVVIPASPTAVLDVGGYIKLIYIPNINGSVYKIDFRSPGTVSSYSVSPSSPPVLTGTEWTVHKIFQPTSGGQPVYHRVEPGTLTETTRYLFFGTGNQDSPVSDGGTGKFYGVMDSDSATATILESSLTNLTTNLTGATATPSPAANGWFVNLASIGVSSGANSTDNNTHSAEKVLSDPVVFFNNVFFTTFTPNAADPCNGGGVARVYGVNMLNATAGLAALTERGESPAGGKVSYHVYSGNPEGGIPSSPSLSIYPNGQSSIFIGFSTGAIKEIRIESPAHMKSIKSWKETF